MNILFVDYNLRTGGISTSLYNLLMKIGENNGFQIDVCLLNNIIDDQFKNVYSVANVFTPSILLDVYYTPFNILKAERNKYKIFLKFILKIFCKVFGNEKTLKILLRRCFVKKKYDVVISYANDIYFKDEVLKGCNDFVENCVEGNMKIGWIHNDPIKLGFTYDICKKTYEKYDVIVNVSYDCKKKFDNIIPEFKNKSKVVYNTFLEEQIEKLAESFNPYNKTDKIKIVTVARAENNQKRLDRVIKVSKRLIDSGLNNFEWYILGDGPDLEYLKKEVVRLELEDIVKFLGNKTNPYPYIKNADCFVLTSKFESYGMVIKESLILKTPVITTEYLAAYEIITNKYNGIICKNGSDDLFEAIYHTIFKSDQLNILKNNLCNNTMDDDGVIKQFISVIKGES